jgi:hypothetical protein
MARLYNPKLLYDPATMPLVDEADTFGCTFVRFHWVPTEAEQRLIDAHWRPLFYRHSLINTKMALATHAGAGVPGWDPFYGMSEVEKDALSSDEYYRLSDQSLGTKIARGLPVKPTGLTNDPRLPERAPEPHGGDLQDYLAGPAGGDILLMLQQAKEHYHDCVRAEYNSLVIQHTTLKAGSWAERAKLAGVAPPTLEDAHKAYQKRLSGPKQEKPWWAPQRTVIPGLWREWEIVEVERERARQNAVERAWQRAEAATKSVLGQTWGGGT